MEVLDGYLDQAVFLRMRDALLADGFPWLRVPILQPAPPGLQPAFNSQLVHGFVQNKPGFRYVSEHVHVIGPVLSRIDARELIKVKVNRTLRRDRNVAYGLHVDTRRRGAFTAILYLNTNDGYTEFEDGRRVASVANRLVVFDASLRHSGASCTDAAERIVLNINFIPKPQPDA